MHFVFIYLFYCVKKSLYNVEFLFIYQKKLIKHKLINHKYTVGEKWFDPLLILYVCPLTKNDQSIILMVGLFEKWDRRTTTKIKQNAFQKSYTLICILMSEISIQSARFLAPRCLLYRCNTMSTWKHTQRIPTQQQKWIITQKSSLPCKSGEGQLTPSLNALVQRYGRLREWFWTPSSLHSRA